MRAVVLAAPWSFGLAEVAEYPLSAGMTTVAPLFVGLCGSDVHVAKGDHARARLPLVLGHEIVGVATDGLLEGQTVVVDPVEGCDACDRCAAGHEQLCDHLGIVGIDRNGGLAETVSVRTNHLHVVPPGLPPEAAALAEVVAVTVHAWDKVASAPGDSIAIVGAGPIGLLVAICARDRGADRIVLVEPAPARRRVAEALGFDVIAPGPGGTVTSLGHRWADVVVDAAGVPSVAAMVTDLARPGGTILVIAVHHTPAEINLPDITLRELRVQGTRACTGSDIVKAMDLLSRRPSVFIPLMTDIVGPEDVGAALARCAGGETMKVLVDCSGLRSS